MEVELTLRVWRTIFEDTDPVYFEKAIWSRLKSSEDSYSGLGADIFNRAADLKLNDESAERCLKDEADEKARKLLARLEADQRVIEAGEAEKRLATPEYQENLRKLDGDFGKYMKDITAKTVAHCDKFIDPNKRVIDKAEYLEPWSQEQIEQTRRKLRAESRA